ncbi:uncharacterized protein LOC141853418 [Brevipalpus obovatus]|uniref:uncharacterized protein LOC141853418 n=1 Tax=Brevipalpus obovatus TaxID=246614 RepID=UPI003D9E4E48
MAINPNYCDLICAPNGQSCSGGSGGGGGDGVRDRKSVVFVKLTDSALSAIENHLSATGKSSSASTVHYGLPPPSIHFEEGSDRGQLVFFDKTGSQTAQYSFNLSNIDAGGPQGSFECLRQQSTKNSNSCTGGNRGVVGGIGGQALESLGDILYKMQIHASEDSYQKTKERMAETQNESKKNCTKVIKGTGLGVGRRAKVKSRPLLGSTATATTNGGHSVMMRDSSNNCNGMNGSSVYSTGLSSTNSSSALPSFPTTVSSSSSCSSSSYSSSLQVNSGHMNGSTAKHSDTGSGSGNSGNHYPGKSSDLPLIKVTDSRGSTTIGKHGSYQFSASSSSCSSSLNSTTTNTTTSALQNNSSHMSTVLPSSSSALSSSSSSSSSSAFLSANHKESTGHITSSQSSSYSSSSISSSSSSSGAANISSSNSSSHHSSSAKMSSSSAHSHQHQHQQQHQNHNQNQHHNQPSNNPELMKRSLRERVIHLLALRPYKKPELMARLGREGLKEKDKKNLSSLFNSIAKWKDNAYHLQTGAWKEVQIDEWPFYNSEQREIVRKRYNLLSSQYRPPISSSDGNVSALTPQQDSSTPPMINNHKIVAVNHSKSSIVVTGGGLNVGSVLSNSNSNSTNHYHGNSSSNHYSVSSTNFSSSSSSSSKRAAEISSSNKRQRLSAVTDDRNIARNHNLQTTSGLPRKWSSPETSIPETGHDVDHSFEASIQSDLWPNTKSSSIPDMSYHNHSVAHNEDTSGVSSLSSSNPNNFTHSQRFKTANLSNWISNSDSNNNRHNSDYGVDIRPSSHHSNSPDFDSSHSPSNNSSSNRRGNHHHSSTDFQKQSNISTKSNHRYDSDIGNSNRTLSSISTNGYTDHTQKQRHAERYNGSSCNDNNNNNNSNGNHNGTSYDSRRERTTTEKHGLLANGHHDHGRGYNGIRMKTSIGQKTSSSSGLGILSSSSANVHGSAGSAGSAGSTPNSSPDSGTGSNDGSLSTASLKSLSSINGGELPDFMLKYPEITNDDQLRRYKDDFNREYSEYRKLHRNVENVTQKFVSYERKLKNQLEGSDEWNKTLEDIFSEYETVKRDYKYADAKRRRSYLHEKLTHIKKLIHDYKHTVQTKTFGSCYRRDPVKEHQQRLPKLAAN